MELFPGAKINKPGNCFKMQLPADSKVGRLLSEESIRDWERLAGSFAVIRREDRGVNVDKVVFLKEHCMEEKKRYPTLKKSCVVLVSSDRRRRRAANAGDLALRWSFFRRLSGDKVA